MFRLGMIFILILNILGLAVNLLAADSGSNSQLCFPFLGELRRVEPIQRLSPDREASFKKNGSAFLNSKHNPTRESDRIDLSPEAYRASQLHLIAEVFETDVLQPKSLNNQDLIQFLKERRNEVDELRKGDHEDRQDAVILSGKLRDALKHLQRLVGQQPNDELSSFLEQMKSRFF